MFKDELGGNIMKEFWALRAKTNIFKGVKRCVIKCRLMFENYTDLLFNNKTILK